jgi:uncharacterized lipoprotein YajG
MRSIRVQSNSRSQTKKNCITSSLLSAVKLPLLLSCIFLSSACSIHLGQTVDTPNIATPTPSDLGSTRARLSTTVALDDIKDVRDSIVHLDKDENISYTEPSGHVPDAVGRALHKTLQAVGVSVLPSADRRIWGEVRTWRTNVSTKAVTQIKSEAVLYLEVLDNKGKRAYSSTYHGSRMSQFPIATEEDIQESLSIAMSQAITQAVSDEGLLNALWEK